MTALFELIAAKLGGGILGYALTALLAMGVTAGSVVLVGAQATRITITGLDLPFSFQPGNLVPVVQQIYAQAPVGAGVAAFAVPAISGGKVVELAALDPAGLKVGAVSERIVAEAAQDNANLQKISQVVDNSSIFQAPADTKLVLSPPKAPGAPPPPPPPPPPPGPQGALPPVGNALALAPSNPSPTAPPQVPTSAPPTQAPTLPPVQTVAVSTPPPATPPPSPVPSVVPTLPPSPVPTVAATVAPTVAPTQVPTAAPTAAPTQAPPQATATPTPLPPTPTPTNTPLPLVINLNKPLTGFMTLPAGVPGDSVSRPITISNGGSGSFTYSLTLTCASGCTSALWTDPLNGLQLTATRAGNSSALYSGPIACLSSPPASNPCGAPTTTAALSVVNNASTAVIVTGGTSDSPVTLQIALPRAEDNTFQGQSVTFSYTWTATSYP